MLKQPEIQCSSALSLALAALTSRPQRDALSGLIGGPSLRPQGSGGCCATHQQRILAGAIVGRGTGTSSAGTGCLLGCRTRSRPSTCLMAVCLSRGKKKKNKGGKKEARNPLGLGLRRMTCLAGWSRYPVAGTSHPGSAVPRRGGNGRVGASTDVFDARVLRTCWQRSEGRTVCLVSHHVKKATLSVSTPSPKRKGNKAIWCYHCMVIIITIIAIDPITHTRSTFVDLISFFCHQPSAITFSFHLARDRKKKKSIRKRIAAFVQIPLLTLPSTFSPSLHRPPPSHPKKKRIWEIDTLGAFYWLAKREEEEEQEEQGGGGGGCSRDSSTGSPFKETSHAAAAAAKKRQTTTTQQQQRKKPRSFGL